MKRFVVAAVTTALLTMPAYSQGMMGGPGGRKHGGGDQKTEQKKPKVDDKAYKSALDKLPDQKKDSDPWRNVRDTPPTR